MADIMARIVDFITKNFDRPGRYETMSNNAIIMEYNEILARLASFVWVCKVKCSQKLISIYLRICFRVALVKSLLGWIKLPLYNGLRRYF